jgi:hypothetical protein
MLPQAWPLGVWAGFHLSDSPLEESLLLGRNSIHALGAHELFPRIAFRAEATVRELLEREKELDMLRESSLIEEIAGPARQGLAHLAGLSETCALYRPDALLPPADLAAMSRRSCWSSAWRWMISPSG